MAYDGIFIKAQLNEIKNLMIDEHISKITQASQRDVSFHIRKNGINFELTLNADPSFPHIVLHEKESDNMKVPKAFCMLLRKYLQGSTIKEIRQIGAGFKKNISKDYFERIIKITFENIDENGDKKKYFILFEVMGKYSNVIITDNNYIIIDTLIKSSVENQRLKQKNIYTIDSVANKKELLSENFDEFMKSINSEKALSYLNGESFDLSNMISKIYAGISKPYIISELIKFISKDNKINVDELDSNFFNYNTFDKYFVDKSDFNDFFTMIKNDINSELNPCINYKGSKPSDFYIFKLNQYVGDIKYFDNINDLIYTYYHEKFLTKGKSTDKKEIYDTIKKLYEKLNKKIDIYKKDLSKCENMDKYKNFGELLSVYGYNKDHIKDGVFTCEDYNHDNILISIPIDESISVAKNVENYYDKFNKLKRTKENAEKLLSETIDKLEHLNSIEMSLDMTDDTNDLFLIKEEILKFFGESHSMSTLCKHKDNVAKRKTIKKQKIEYNIHHYKSHNGIDIYVGKNNLQNEYLTFTMASQNDTWLHIKGSTGSHVIVKKPYTELDDKTLIEAASLAAYFSDKKNETKATVDYTLKKELKKVKGKPPGFCIYHTNYSINVKPEVLVSEV